MEKKLRTIQEIKDMRKNIGFHFTPKVNMDSILAEGLRPQIGANSSGGLGKEANDKTFLSYGLEGVLQLYNRLLHIGFQNKIKDLNTPSHFSYIPDNAREKEEEEHLTPLESFEFTRQYMEDNIYIIFDCPTKNLEAELSGEDIAEINNEIKFSDTSKRIDTLDGISDELRSKGVSLEKIREKVQKDIEEQYKELSSKKSEDKQKKIKRKIEIKKAMLEELSDITEENRDDYLRKIPEKRARLSNDIRRITSGRIQQKISMALNGEEVRENDEAIIDRYDFNEDKLRWEDQIRRPSNAHTRLVDDGEYLKGIVIDKSKISMYSRDGKLPATGIQFLEDFYSHINEQDLIANQGDCSLIPKFIEYLKMVKEYQEQGLLYKKSAHDEKFDNEIRHYEDRMCMDLSDLKKYEVLQEFSDMLMKETEAVRLDGEISIKAFSKNAVENEQITQEEIDEADKAMLELSKKRDEKESEIEEK